MKTPQTQTTVVEPSGSASPLTDDAWDKFNRKACGLHYVAHKMRALEVALREVIASAHPHPTDNPAMHAAWKSATALLSPNADSRT